MNQTRHELSINPANLYHITPTQTNSPCDRFKQFPIINFSRKLMFPRNNAYA